VIEMTNHNRAALLAAASLLLAQAVGAQVTNVDTTEVFADLTSALADADTVDGQTLQLDAGVFAEDVLLEKRVNLLGAGSGPGGSVVDGEIEIRVGGLSAAEPLTFQDLRVTGAGEGFRISRSLQFLYFSRVAAVGNTANGMHFNLTGLGPVSGVVIESSLFEGNRGGIRTSSDAVVDEVRIVDTDVVDNKRYGIALHGVTNVNDGKSRDWMVTGGSISYNGEAATAFGGGLWLGTSGPGSEIADFVVDGVEFRDNGGGNGYGIRAYALPDTLFERVLVTRSTFIDSADPGDQLAGMQVFFLNGLTGCGGLQVIDNDFVDLGVGITGQRQVDLIGTRPGIEVFDNLFPGVGQALQAVIVVQCRSVLEIPTASPLGLLVLIAALLAGGLWRLRRQATIRRAAPEA